MAELSYSYIPGTSYSIPDFSSYLFGGSSLSIPNIPTFTPVTVPTLPTFYTLEELLGVTDASQIFVPYVPPAVSAYDPKLTAIRLDAITLQQELGDALAKPSIRI